MILKTRELFLNNTVIKTKNILSLVIKIFRKWWYNKWFGGMIKEKYVVGNLFGYNSEQKINVMFCEILSILVN
jgi:hypothetical protein